MDKGIRPATLRKFAELNVERRATITGGGDAAKANTLFRKSVMSHIMEEFGITLASAATHYNHALIDAKAKTPADVEGLGRPDDKKGGRKPKPKTPEAPKGTVIPQPTNQLLQNLINAGAVKQPAAVITAEAAAVGLEGILEKVTPELAVEMLREAGVETPQGGEEAPEAPPQDAVTLYTVFKSVKGTEVAKDLTEAQADELIAKAAGAKKAKLEKRAQ